ncbi:MAG: dihydrolipoyl dehydrogenase family protein [Acidimicrobiales bacterium]
MDFDVAILGGGAAGLSAARETLRRGANPVIVNAGPLGGDCTFTGCVPSKTVIETSLAGGSFTDAFERARTVVDHIASTENAERLTEEGVVVIEDEGTLTTVDGQPAISVDGRTLSAKGVVLALGSKPLIPPIEGLETVDYLTTENLWELQSAPRSMAVIGGGAIGCELSQALARLGVQITLIEMADRVLGKEEVAASTVAAEALTAGGVDVMTGVGVTAARKVAGGAELTLDSGATIEAERVLVVVGRRPNSHRGGLEAGGITLERGFVGNGDDLATSVRGVYVAGDLAGRLQFTHAADHMGRIAAGNILGRWARLRPARFRADQIPWVTFVTPEIARIGMTESEAARSVPGAMVAYLPLTEHDRALTAGVTEGYIKLIAGPRPVIGMAGGGRIIGATIVSERAGEIISEIALAVRVDAFVGRLAQTVHPYPTWSFGLVKAAAQFFTTVEGRAAKPAQEESGHFVG